MAFRACTVLLVATARASSERESLWRGRAPVRLRGGGAVLSQLSGAGPLEEELSAMRAALDASQKAARKARREARRREAALQAELDDLEAGKRADALRAQAPPPNQHDATGVVVAAAGGQQHGQATSVAASETLPSQRRSGVTRTFRVLNTAVLLSCAAGLAAAPSRSIRLLLQVDLSAQALSSSPLPQGVGFLAALLARTVSALLAFVAASLWLMVLANPNPNPNPNPSPNPNPNPNPN